MINTLLAFTRKTMMYQKNWLTMRRLSFQAHFLQASTENCINVEVIGKRKRGVGLIIPAKCNAFTRNGKIAMTLDKKLTKHQKLYKSCLELKHQLKNIYGKFPLYINNRTEYNKISTCMLFPVIFKLTHKIPMNSPY